MGLPVVSFASGSIPEAIAHGQTGLLAREGDTEILATYLITLLTDVGLWDRMSGAGVQHVRKHFDLRRQTARLEDLYDSVSVICRAMD